MAVSFVGVVDRVPICDFAKEGTWVVGERVKQ